MHTPHVLSGGRYPVLRALAIIYVIGAALAALATAVGFLYALVRGDGSFANRIIIAAAALGAGFFLVITMLAIAEVLKLFIDVEHNTRMAVPGRNGMPAAMSPAEAHSDGGRMNRIDALDEETAEAALLRGH
ncbi:MAG: hypothetical protein ABIP55_06100 [Tepidisphaeraceae bacterium]